MQGEETTQTLLTIIILNEIRKESTVPSCTVSGLNIDNYNYSEPKYGVHCAELYSKWSEY